MTIPALLLLLLLASSALSQPPPPPQESTFRPPRVRPQFRPPPPQQQQQERVSQGAPPRPFRPNTLRQPRPPQPQQQQQGIQDRIESNNRQRRPPQFQPNTATPPNQPPSVQQDPQPPSVPIPAAVPPQEAHRPEAQQPPVPVQPQSVKESITVPIVPQQQQQQPIASEHPRPERQPQPSPQAPPPPPTPAPVAAAAGGGRNEPPVLTPGNDLLDFEIPEDTKVDTEVYTLKATDPENSKVFYTISGDYFTINRDTGVIKLREALDREAIEVIEVVITIQDEAFNLIPFRREIRVSDVNDNAPKFLGSPYRFNLSETSPLNEVVFTSVALTDADKGDNGEVFLTCDAEESGEAACDTFHVEAQELAPGSYIGLISLKRALDFESRSSYSLVLRAQDEGKPSLNASATVLVEVNDVQDQSPHFVNAPYSATVEENTPPGTAIFTILVRDGDTGLPRHIDLSLVGDTQGFFTLDLEKGHDPSGLLTAILKTTERKLDREMDVILAEGGLYAFQILAREMDGNGGFGDSVATNVTIVVTDQNDEIPTFNRNNFTVAVPEDVGVDTPLPDLNIVVNDADVALNAEYELRIEDVQNSEGVFSVYPTKAIGRTPVIIRVENPERLDYEKDEGRNFVFKVNAMQGQEVLSSVTVTVMVTDSNDNVPVFEKQVYEFSVPEDSEPGTLVGQITAVDTDSGRFGQVEYALKGFGAEQFSVDTITGQITVDSCGGGNEGGQLQRCLDFESQQSYSLTYTGTDGGKQITATNVVIRIEDVNDNFPIFEHKEYLRVVPESATAFEQPLFLQATDKDGPAQGGGKIFYAIHSINTEATVFAIDPVTGEVKFVQAAQAIDTQEGRYEMVVRATDGGKPPLFSDVKVTVKVGSISNQTPKFSLPSYEASVPENAPSGHAVLQLDAEDPDGPKTDLRFVLHSGTKDNFAINETTGLITVSPDASLDIQRSGDTYDVIVQVVDKGEPFSQTGQTMVKISVLDINDKKPKFEKNSYTEHVLESSAVGQAVLQVLAYDSDRNANLEYTIVEPISARDKTGNSLQNRAAYDFSKAFSVDPVEGKVVVNSPLSHNSAAVIILTIQAKDLNAEEQYPDQVATAEATFYIQAYKADSPQFSSPWTPSEPTVTFEVKEEQPVGTVLFALHAKDPLTGQPITHYEKLAASDPDNLIDVSPLTGDVVSKQPLDFELMKEITFQVRATAGEAGSERFSDASVVMKLVDINDNAPVFEQEEYVIDMMEDVFPLAEVMTVTATDVDAGPNGDVRYSIAGEGTDTFTVDPKTGVISVKAGPDGRSIIDREKQSEYLLRVTASDIPQGGPEQRSSHTQVRIRVQDVNDSPPSFSQSRYSAVVPENSPPGTPVVRVEATDPDLGEAGAVQFKFPEGGKADAGLFSINSDTGEIFTAVALTGKGRQAPYLLTVRALDKGVTELFSDTDVYITVGDVSSNDGVPEFVRPNLDELAYIKENSSAGSVVFHVEARDPDDPETANGKMVYSLPDDGSVIRKLFQIDPVSGTLTTKVKLDREERSEYTVILNVNDLGSPPQQTSRLLRVIVQDVDDHAPIFNRQRNSVPVELEVLEELPVGTKIGEVFAVDEDEGDNAIIDYAIVDGNVEKIFNISRGENNQGVISVARRLDREYSGFHLLTIKCFRPYERNVKSLAKKYTNTKMDEIQVKVIVRDIDDNSPSFVEHNVTLGVRVNDPVYTTVTMLKAVDADADSAPVYYALHNLTYYRPRTNSREIIEEKIFIMDPTSGALQTNATLGRFADGYFNVVLKASNGVNDTKSGDFTSIKVYVLQDTELMKFVFDRDPSLVRQKLPEFKQDIETLFSAAKRQQQQQMKFHLYDTEFYSKVDGSLDFGRTSSCFQVVEGDNVVDLKTSEGLLDYSEKPDLKDLYDKYDIVGVERCATIHSTNRVDWVEVFLLVIAALIGVLAFIAAIIVCCLYSNYKRTLRRNAPVKIVEAPVRAYIPASLPPGSIMSPSIAGGSRVLYDWQESTIPIDAVSYRSLPHQ